MHNYRAASRENRIIAWVFLSGGVGLIAAGAFGDDNDFGVGRAFLTVDGVVLSLAMFLFLTARPEIKRK